MYRKASGGVLDPFWYIWHCVICHAELTQEEAGR